MKALPILLRHILAALLLCFASLPGMAGEIVVEHAQGRTVLPDRAERIFVFDLASLDTLDALGAEVAGVPGSNIPDYLAKYRGDAYARVGTLFQPDYEAVHAGKPDVVIVAGRSAPAYAELSRIAPTIDLSLDPGAFAQGVRRNTEILGRITGKEKEAAALTEKLDAAIAGIRDKAKDAGRALIIMVSGGKITAYGKGSRFGWVHDDLGIEPAVADLDAATHGEAVSFEFLLKTNPDWLFVLDRDSVVGSAGASARQALDNELVAATSAAKKDRIVYVDTARWYLVGGGIGALQDSVERIGEVLDR